jgi:hypothetical protein
MVAREARASEGKAQVRRAVHRETERRGRRAPLAVSTLLLSSFLAPSLPAEPGFLRYSLTGGTYGDTLGWSLAALGDVDGDGVPDFGLGVAEDGRYIPGDKGRVAIVSGRSGREIRSWRSDEPWYGYGRFLAAAGDLDGDGVTDLLAGGPYFVESRCGRTGELLGIVRDRKLDQYSIGLASIGDVDGDGVPEFAIGNPREELTHRGRVTLHCGRTGEVLWVRWGEGPNDVLGRRIVGLGDVDGDGVPDLAAGAPGIPAVLMLKGQDGAEIHRLTLGEGAYGSRLAALGDLDGDGVQEIAVGAPGFRVRGFPGGGRVDVVSGRNGRLLWSVTGEDFDRWPLGTLFRGDGLGGELANAGDADGDGLPDLLMYASRTGVAGEDWGRVYLRSGSTGALLAAYENERNDTRFGRNLSGLGDLDGDGRAEFLIAAPVFDEDPPGLQPPPPINLGRVYAIGYRPEGRRFIRADADLDGEVTLSDGIAILLHLFAGRPAGCLEALDVNRSREINLTDALHVLIHLFASGMAPHPPYPDCGAFESFKTRLSCERSFCD